MRQLRQVRDATGCSISITVLEMHQHRYHSSNEGGPNSSTNFSSPEGVSMSPVIFIFLHIILPRGRQELGGNKTGAWASFTLLFLLWVLYIAVSCLATYGFVTLSFS